MAQGACRTTAASLGGLLALMVGCGDGPRGPCTTTGPIETVCGFQNPEDIEYLPSANIVLATNMRLRGRGPDGVTTGGFLSMLDLGTGTVRKVWPTDAPEDVAFDPQLADPVCTMPPRSGTFHPHGLTATAAGGRTIVYVVGHEPPDGGREAIEVFEVAGRGAATRVAWKGCIPVEARVTGNDVAVASDGEVIVSNYQPSASVWHTIKANLLGMDTGDVRGWRRGRGWQHIPHTSARQPNGVAVSADGTALFFSETGTGKVHRLSRRDPSPPSSVDVGGHPDNFAWTPSGKLLVAIHTGGAAFMPCVFGYAPCRTSWEIHEIDPEAMTSTLLLAGDGEVLGAVSTPLVIGEMMYLGSVFDDRIGVVRLPAR
jgi:hypothetical protein